MDKRTFIVKHDNPRWQDVRERAIAAIREWTECADAMIRLSDVVRTLDQNSAMWPALTDFAEQVDWPHTEAGQWVIGKMSKEAWKAVLTAAFEGEADMAQGWSGGTVMVGASTSKYGRRKMADFLKFVRAEGTDRGVIWSEKATDNFAEYISDRKAA